MMSSIPLEPPAAAIAPARLHLPRGLASCAIDFVDRPTLATWSFSGRRPRVVADEARATVTVDYGRRAPFGRAGRGRIALAADRQWTIECGRGMADVEIDARRPALEALILTGGVSGLSLRLGAPVRPVELRFGSGAAGIEILRAPGVPVTLRLVGGYTDVRVDGARYRGAGGGEPIRAGDVDAGPGLDVTFESSAARVELREDGSRSST